MKQHYSPEIAQQKTEAATGVILLRKGETCNFIKKEIPLHVFYCEFWKLLKTTFLQNTSGWVLLKSHQKSLAGDTWLKNYSEQINKIPEAKKSKAVKLKPSSILIKYFVGCVFLVI